MEITNIYRKTLDSAGYQYEEFKGPAPNVTTLTVEYDDINKITPVVREAEKRAQESKRRKYN